MFAIALLIGVSSACSHVEASKSAKAQLLPYERIHKRIRKFARLENGQRMLVCNSLVFYGRAYPPAGEPDPSAEIVIADGLAIYFDNGTGAQFARCDYWYCTKHSRYCNTRCPPKEWTCDGIDSDSPANNLLERTRER